MDKKYFRDEGYRRGVSSYKDAKKFVGKIFEHFNPKFDYIKPTSSSSMTMKMAA